MEGKREEKRKGKELRLLAIEPQRGLFGLILGI